jgi:hypothetical protein
LEKRGGGNENERQLYSKDDSTLAGLNQLCTRAGIIPAETSETTILKMKK